MNVDYNIINRYYSDKLKEHGPTAKGMDWKNEDTQYLRFETIVKYIDFKGSPSILDVGCGTAELKNFLIQKSFPFEYLGLDLVPDMVNFVNQRFGNGSALVGNMLELDFNRKFDYVVASGTFNAKLTNDDEAWRIFFFKNIEKMYSCCSKGVIFNCMSQFVDWRYDRLYYANMSDFSSFIVHNISRKFIIDHSYPLYEATFVIYK